MRALLTTCVVVAVWLSALVEARTAAENAELQRLHNLLAQGRATEAVTGLKSFLALHDSDGLAWLYMGHALILPGPSYDVGLAVSAYRNAVNQLHDDEPVEDRAKALLWLGVSLRRAQKDIPASLVYITRALELAPRDSEAHTHAATSYSMTSDLANALKHLMASTLISSPERQARDYSRIADILMRVHDWETASAVLAQCFQRCVYDMDGKAAMQVNLLRMATIAGRKLGRDVSGLEKKAIALAGSEAAWQREVRDYIKANEGNWDIVRDAVGLTPEQHQAILRPIIQDPASHPPPLPYEPDWSDTCQNDVKKFKFPFGCAAKLEAFLLRSRRAFANDSHVAFSNAMLDPLQCLWNPVLTAGDCRWVARVVAARSAPPPAALQLPQRANYPEKPARLHVGVFTADWSPVHPMQRLVSALLRHYPRDLLTITLFHRDASDTSTTLLALAPLVDAHVFLDDFTTEESYREIRARNCHVYLDCSGKTGSGLAGILSLKPAPVVFSWGGQPGTTGNERVDYVVADRWTLPLELARSTVTEQVLYLPGSWLFTDHRTYYRTFQPEYRTDAALRMQMRAKYGVPRNAFVYGSFNRQQKLDHFTLDSICQVMNRVRSAVFLQVFHGSEFPQEHRDNMVEYWVKGCGLPAERLVQVTTLAQGEHLQVAASVVDVALDSVMYNGGLTMADLLFAGVPVVTMSGPLHKWTQRMGGSVLRAAGVGELIAADYEEYTALAVRLHGDSAFYQRIRGRILQAHSRPDADQVLFQPEIGARKMAEGMRLAYDRWRAGLPLKDILADRAWYARNADVLQLPDEGDSPTEGCPPARDDDDYEPPEDAYLIKYE